jgi:hypothetical protein
VCNEGRKRGVWRGSWGGITCNNISELGEGKYSIGYSRERAIAHTSPGGAPSTNEDAISTLEAMDELLCHRGFFWS